MNKVLMAEVNISEGTNKELIEKVKKSFIDEKNIEIVDIDSWQSRLPIFETISGNRKTRVN